MGSGNGTEFANVKRLENAHFFYCYGLKMNKNPPKYFKIKNLRFWIDGESTCVIHFAKDQLTQNFIMSQTSSATKEISPMTI